MTSSPRFPIPVPPYEVLKPFVDEVLHYHLPFVFSLPALSTLHPELSEQQAKCKKAEDKLNARYRQSTLFPFFDRIRRASVELLAYLKHGDTVQLIALLARIYSLDTCKELLDGLVYKRGDYEEIIKLLSESESESELLTYAADLARYIHDFPSHCPECDHGQAAGTTWMEVCEEIEDNPERNWYPLKDEPMLNVGDHLVRCKLCKAVTKVPFVPQANQSAKPSRTTTFSNDRFQPHLGPPPYTLKQTIEPFDKTPICSRPFTFLEYASDKLEERVKNFVQKDYSGRDHVLSKRMISFVKQLGELAGYFEIDEVFLGHNCIYRLRPLNWIRAEVTDYDHVYRFSWLSREFQYPLYHWQILKFIDDAFPVDSRRAHYRTTVRELMENKEESVLDLDQLRWLAYALTRDCAGYPREQREDYTAIFVTTCLHDLVSHKIRKTTHPEVSNAIAGLFRDSNRPIDITWKSLLFSMLFSLHVIPNAFDVLLEFTELEARGEALDEVYGDEQ